MIFGVIRCSVTLQAMSSPLADASILDMPTVATPPQTPSPLGSRQASITSIPGKDASVTGGSNQHNQPPYRNYGRQQQPPAEEPVRWSFEEDGSFSGAPALQSAGAAVRMSTSSAPLHVVTSSPVTNRSRACVPNHACAWALGGDHCLVSGFRSFQKP